MGSPLARLVLRRWAPYVALAGQGKPRAPAISFSFSTPRGSIGGIVANNASGMCCGTSDAAEIQTSAREAIAHGLAGSVASDFHGRLQPWNRLGGVAPLPGGIPSIAERLDV